MIRAVIFDLDNCLSAADAVGTALFEPAFEAIRAANHGTLVADALKVALDDCWRHSLDSVAAKHGFSSEMLAAGWREMCEVETTTPMRGYDDLAVLAEIEATRFLVTTGFRRLQESKIRALGVAHLFEAVYVDSIDEAGHNGKEQIFSDILGRHGWEPAEVLVVGDNPESEIAAGNRLGMVTVQILRPGVAFSANASRHVHSLSEVRELVASSQRDPASAG